MNFNITHLTPVTAAWLIASALALFFAYRILVANLKDRDLNEEVANGLYEARMLVVNGLIFRSRIRVGIFAWWTFLGILFGFFDVPDIPRLAGLLGLIASAFGWTIIGAQETMERKTLDALIIGQHNNTKNGT